MCTQSGIPHSHGDKPLSHGYDCQFGFSIGVFAHHSEALFKFRYFEDVRTCLW